MLFVHPVANPRHYVQRKDIYIEHCTGPARRPAWLAKGKCPSRASFVGDGGFIQFPMCAHFPRNETLDSLSTLTSCVLHLRSRVKSRTAGRGQWGMIMGRPPLPAVRDLTRDGRWSTDDVGVLKKMGGEGRCAQTGHPPKLPSPTKLARLGHFPPASQAGHLGGPLFYVYVFSLGMIMSVITSVGMFTQHRK
jgi:hypothetical protein